MVIVRSWQVFKEIPSLPLPPTPAQNTLSFYAYMPIPSCHLEKFQALPREPLPCETCLLAAGVPPGRESWGVSTADSAEPLRILESIWRNTLETGR